MNKPGMILIGAGGHAHACIDVIEQDGRFCVAGLVGVPEDAGTSRLEYPVIGTDDELSQLANDHRYAIVSVGQIRTPDVRMRLFQQLVAIGFELPAIVSPAAYVSRHAVVGAGTIVMHGAIVNAGARVGSNCIINTNALVEHDAIVDDHCHISTGAILNGGVAVGEGSFVGSGSVIKEGVCIGKRCLIGMRQSVRHNHADHTRVAGGGDS